MAAMDTRQLESDLAEHRWTEVAPGSCIVNCCDGVMGEYRHMDRYADRDDRWGEEGREAKNSKQRREIVVRDRMG
jgi:hypothetical protein